MVLVDEGNRSKSSKCFGDYTAIFYNMSSKTKLHCQISIRWFLFFIYPSSMLRTKLARWEEKQSTRVLQCTLAQHVCPVDKQTCVRYPWKESVVMRQKNGNNFSSFWIKNQGGHEGSKEAAEHLENLWWWHTGIPNAAFLFVPHGCTHFPCPWTDAMEDSTVLGFDMRDGRSGTALMRRVMMWSPHPLPPSLTVPRCASWSWRQKDD